MTDVQLTPVAERVALLEMRRPPNNFFDEELLTDLADALHAADEDSDLTCVVLADPVLVERVWCWTGRGRRSARAGPRRVRHNPDLVTAHLVRTRGRAGRVLHRITVRAHGACAGIGLPAFAGRIVADPGTSFWLPEVAMGLIRGAGGTVGIPRRIGRWRTLYLALSGASLDVATGLASGVGRRRAW